MTIVTIPGQIIKMDTPTGIDPVWYDKLKQLIETVNTFGSIFGSSTSRVSAVLGADVLVNNITLYFDGPGITLGAGTWFVSGSVAILDTTAAVSFLTKLWDGTSVIASGVSTTAGANFQNIVSLSGFITSPAGNVRISVKAGLTTGKIIANLTGSGKDSTISAFRIA